MLEVDGEVVRERSQHLAFPLRLSPGDDGSRRLTEIAENNARFNIGDVVRTVNEPTFVLSFLRPSNRDRVRFVLLGEDDVPPLSVADRFRVRR